MPILLTKINIIVGIFITYAFKFIRDKISNNNLLIDCIAIFLPKKVANIDFKYADYKGHDISNLILFYLYFYGNEDNEYVFREFHTLLPVTQNTVVIFYDDTNINLDMSKENGGLEFGILKFDKNENFENEKE